MATFTSNFFADGKTAISPSSAGEVYVAEGTVYFPATLADGDIAKICYLPANCIPIDLVVHTQELDSHGTDTLTFSVGLLNDDEDAIITASTLLSGGTAEAVQTIRGDGAGFIGITRDVDDDRILAVEITADPETGTAGYMRVILTYRVSEWGV